MEVQNLDYCYGEVKDRLLSYFASGKNIEEINWTKKECRGRRAKILLELELTEKISRECEEQATKEANIHGGEYIRNAYGCRNCNASKKNEKRFYEHLTQERKCFNFYKKANQKNYDCM